MAWDFETEPELEEKRAWIHLEPNLTTNGSLADFLVVMWSPTLTSIPTTDVPTRRAAAREKFVWLAHQLAVSS